MNIRLAQTVACLSLITLLSCVAHSGRVEAGTDARVMIKVVSALDSGVALPGVEVSVVEGNGSVQILGVTSASGRLDVPKQYLIRSGASAVLCCHPLFTCGAIRVSKDRLLSFDEYLIPLAPLVVY